MTDATTGRASPRWSRVGLVVLTAAFTAVGRLWRSVASLAEMLSDAGHGPFRWRERSGLPNPYAGMGPIPADEEPRENTR